MRASRPISVITGATGALGLAVASELVRLGHGVVLIGRDRVHLSEARTELECAGRGATVAEVVCDLSSMLSVRAAAEAIRKQGPIDALVHCAGVFSAARRVSADGYELMVATNHLGPTLLTLLLEQALSAAGSARVVFVTAPFRTPLRLEDPMSTRAFRALEVFARSKAMSLSFACELAQRWRGTISVFGADPGKTRSRLLREAPLPLRLALAALASAPEATRTPIVRAATALAMVSGQFIRHRSADMLSAAAADADTRRRLWELSIALVGMKGLPEGDGDG